MTRITILGITFMSAICAGIQAQPQITATGNDIEIRANGRNGEVTIGNSRQSCTASELCGLTDQLSTLASAVSTLTSELSTARSTIARIEAAQNNTGVSSNSGNLGNSLVNYISLGAMSNSDLLTIDYAVSACQFLTNGKMMVVRHFEPSNQSPLAVSDSIEGSHLSPQSLNTSLKPRLFTKSINGDSQLHLVMKVTKPSGCASQATYEVKITSFKKDFDPAVGGNYVEADYEEVQFSVIGKIASENRAFLDGIFGCSEDGQRYDPITGECVENEVTSLGSTSTIVRTFSASTTEGNRLVFSVPSAITDAGTSIFANVEYTCEYTAGTLTSPIFGAAVVTARGDGSTSVMGTSGGEVLDPQVPSVVRISWNSTFVGDAGNVNDARLALYQPTGFECMVSIISWNGTSGDSTRFIPLVNPSFEFPRLTRGSWVDDVQRVGVIDGWDYLIPPQGQSIRDNGGLVNSGIYASTTTAYTIHSGTQVAFTNPWGGMQQDTGVSATPDTTYEVGVWVYQRYGFPGFRLYLCIGTCIDSENVLQSSEVTAWQPSPGYTNLRKHTFTYTTGGNPPGGTLNIWFHALGSGGQLNFDHFTLAATPTN